jgi:hypothetical protein
VGAEAAEVLEVQTAGNTTGGESQASSTSTAFRNFEVGLIYGTTRQQIVRPYCFASNHEPLFGLLLQVHQLFWISRDDLQTKVIVGSGRDEHCYLTGMTPDAK